MSLGEIEEITIGYFNQLLHGCNRILCTESKCRSCPNFSDNIQTETDAAYEALLLTRNHVAANHLCYGVNPTLIHPQYISTIVLFDQFLDDLVQNKIDLSKDFVFAYEAFSNPDIFGLSFHSNSLPLSLTNISLDDAKLFSLISAIPQHGQFLSSNFHTSYELMISSLIHSPCVDSFHHIRTLIFSFIFEIFITPTNFQSTLVPLMDHIMMLPTNSKSYFVNNITAMPNLFRHITTTVLNSFSLFLISTSTCSLLDKSIQTSIQFIQFLKDTNLTSESPLQLDFSNEIFASYFDPLKELLIFEASKLSVFCFPAILPIEFKRHAYSDGLQGNNGRSKMIRISRQNIVRDTIRIISQMSQEDFLSRISVQFIGEEGIDQGGVSREFFHLLIHKIFSPDYGMFVIIKNKYYWFKQICVEDLNLFNMIGVIISLAIYNHIVLPIRFPLLLYKKILGWDIKMIDFEEIEPEVANSFKQMKEMENVEDLCLTFTAVVDNFGQKVEKDIVPGGSEIAVTNENLDRFILSYIEWYCNESIKNQFNSFKNGLLTVLKQKYLSIFSPEEMDILVSGEEVFDWEELEKNAKYSDGFNRNSRCVKWFWKLFSTLTNDEKKKFLFFVTGTDRAPLGGLKNMVITIQKAASTDALPVAHTCFHILQLPDYRSEKILRDKMLFALQNCEGFGLV